MWLCIAQTNAWGRQTNRKTANRLGRSLRGIRSIDIDRRCKYKCTYECPQSVISASAVVVVLVIAAYFDTQTLK